MTQYYDLVLFLIPLALTGISGALWAAGIALTIAIPTAGVVAMALIGHAMFVRGPVASPTGTSPAEKPGLKSTD